MKTPSIALLNSIGFTNYAEKALYAATLLQAAIVHSPAIKISNAVAGVPGKRAVDGYAGFAGFAAQTAAQNTTGKLAGEVFPGRPAVAAIAASNGYAAVVAIPALPPSPAYPAGTAIPAYPVVASRAAVVETAPVVAVPAIDAPAITPLPGYGEAIEIVDLGDRVTQITAYLPVASSPSLIGSTVSKVLEITPPSLTALVWVGEKASNTPGTETTLPATLEEAFLVWAENALSASLDAGSITMVNRPIGGTFKTCKKVVLKVQRSENWNAANPDIQLSTVGYYSSDNGSGGNGSGSVIAP